jgi:hypothetical protein
MLRSHFHIHQGKADANDTSASTAFLDEKCAFVSAPATVSDTVATGSDHSEGSKKFLMGKDSFPGPRVEAV